MKNALILLIVTLSLSLPEKAPAEKITIIAGRKGEAAAETVNAPNISKNNGTGKWTQSSSPIRPDAALTTAPQGASEAPPSSGLPAHGTTAAEKTQRKGSSKRTSLNSFDTENSSATSQSIVANISGNQTYTYKADEEGDIVLSPCLRTISGAEMTIRLYDANGTEVTFGSSSLLEWKRTNDKDFAPLTFKGNRDNDSMYLHGTGDYSPKEDLHYRINLKPGQKIVVKTTGQPLSSNSIKIYK